VLASGAVISMSALTGGVAPALAKPGHDDPGIPIVPTTEVVAPPQAPQDTGQAPAEQPRAPKGPPQQALAPEIQAPAPAPQPEPQAPPQQAPAPEPVAPAPQVEAPPPPPKKEQPRTVDAPKADPPKVDAPKADSPAVDAPKADPPKVDAPQVDAPKADTPKPDTPKVDAPTLTGPNADAPKADTPAPPAAADQPGKPADPNADAQVPRDLTSGQPNEPGADPAAPGKGPKVDAAKPGTDGSHDGQGADPSDPSAISKAAKQIPTAAPDTLKAPDSDIQLAKQATPVEVKPEPAAKQDVDFLSSALNISSKTKLGPFQSEFNVGSEFSIGDRNRDRDWDRDRDRAHENDWDWDKKNWDHKVRQWDRRWIQYDDFYRPIFYNPFRAPVRIVYLYERAPRIVILPPLGRVVVDAAALAAYSFTAVVLNAANLAADVAVGSFFGGGIIPPVGVPFVPPPPLLSYDNVPVQVRYSNATYQPFRVNRIVDLGDDAQYGGRKVLLDGATPAWGQWTTAPNGERQFEVHRTQEYPGLGDPQEAPLPGDYQMRLASDESANVDHTQMYLIAAAGVIAGLGFGALGLALYLGRRRPQL
jgi:hypothetical protein